MKRILERTLQTLLLIIITTMAAAAQNPLADFTALNLSYPQDILLSAVKSSNECLKYNPNSRECLEGRGVLYFHLKDYDKALIDLNKVLAVSPQKPFILYCRGIIFKSKSDDDAAMTDFNKANELKPNVKEILIARSQIYLSKKNFEPALADLNQVIAGSPSFYPAYNYRGIVYAAQQNYKLAAADFTKAISINSQFADAFYQRGQAYANLGNAVKSKADLASAAKLDPKYAGGTANISTAAAVKTISVKPVSNTVTSAAWKRNVLTGTGISVESPEVFKLTQDTPDPLSETQTAYVYWTLSVGKVFTNVAYEKNTELTTAKQRIESAAEISSGSHKVLSNQVREAIFLNQPSAILDQRYFDEKKREEFALLQFCFGSPGELTMFTAVYPVADAAAKLTALKIYNSIKVEGAHIAETPKMPPTNWQRKLFHGLSFETPLKEFDTSCREKFSLKITDVVCYQWGKYLSLSVSYQQYASAVDVPSVAVMTAARISSDNEIDQISKSQNTVENKAESFAVAEAEAGRLKIDRGFGTGGTHEEIVYIKRGREVWEVRVYYFIRWTFDQKASERIVNSLKDTPLSPIRKAPSELFGLERYKQTLEDLGKGIDVSDKDIEWALQYEKTHPELKNK